MQDFKYLSLSNVKSYLTCMIGRIIDPIDASVLIPGSYEFVIIIVKGTLQTQLN